MISKLKKKIFWILMVSISTVLIGAIIIFAYINYRSSINAATSIMEKVNDFGKIQENIVPPENEQKIDDESNKPPRGEIKLDAQLDDTYYYIIEDGTIINKSESDSEEIENMAIKISKKKTENGFIENYIYKVSKGRNDSKIVMLMKNENVIKRIRIIFVLSGIACLVVLIITYFISRNVSTIIVRPVEETIEKQKQFISDASHELKTPLAVIEANADVLESEVGSSKWMGYIQSEISSMDKLINNLLLLAKTEREPSLNINEEINLSEEIMLTCSMFESMAYEKSIKINYNIEDDVKIGAYREDIKQVVSILVDNAIKHTKEDGNIFIELQKERNGVLIQVKNEGEPIPEGERNKIFERFYRVDKSRNRKEKRYGLGLAIAKSIVEKYNGKIDVLCQNGVTNFRVFIWRRTQINVINV